MTYDYERMYLAVKALEKYVLDEPRLEKLVQPAQELARQARSLLDGEPDTPPVFSSPSDSVPDQECARELVRLLSEIPNINPNEETPETVNTFARFMANIALGITSPLFRSHADIVREGTGASYLGPKKS